MTLAIFWGISRIVSINLYTPVGVPEIMCNIFGGNFIRFGTNTIAESSAAENYFHNEVDEWTTREVNFAEEETEVVEEEGVEEKKEFFNCLCSMSPLKWSKWAAHPGKCCASTNIQGPQKRNRASPVMRAPATSCTPTERQWSSQPKHLFNNPNSEDPLGSVLRQERYRRTFLARMHETIHPNLGPQTRRRRRRRWTKRSMEKNKERKSERRKAKKIKYRPR